MRWLTSMQLRSRDAGTRARAARKLGVAGKGDNAADLEPLLRDTDAGVRRAAVEALGAVGGEAVVPLLLAAARGADEVRPEAESASLRDSVVEALGAVGSAAVPNLLGAATDRHARVRECAVAALGRIGGDEAAEGLARALADDRSALRQLAARALARTSGGRAVHHLARALAHRDAATRSAAAEALGQTGSEEAVPPLRQALGDRDRQVQAAAARALAAIGRAGGIDALVEALAEGDRERRQAAAHALRAADWTPATDRHRALHAALHGRFDSITETASSAVSVPAVVELLKVALTEKDAAVRAGAAGALGRLRDGSAAAALGALLGDPDPAAREAGERALGALGPAALDAVLPALEDRSVTRRAAARRVLDAANAGRVADDLVDRLLRGQAATHAGLPLRVVDRLEALDAARHAADALDRLLRVAPDAFPPSTLQRAAELADVVFIEPGQVPAAGERLDLEDLRSLAARVLSATGPAPRGDRGAAR